MTSNTNSIIPIKPRVLPPVKPPRIICEHFDIATYKIDQAHGYVEADCQHCGATIKGQKNVTSNFIQHMRRRHPEAYVRFAASSTHRAKRPRLSSPAKTPSIPPTPVPDPPRPRPDPTPTPEITLEVALVSATFRAAVRTPCEHATLLSAATRCHLYIKREDKQIAGSPIFRAAYNYLAATPTSRAGVVTAGLSALPTACAAAQHAKPCHVLLPASPPPALLRLLAAQDAKVEIASHPLSEMACIRAAELNRSYVELATSLVPGCAHAVAGYATLALELLQQCPHADRVFVAAGNALLFSGLSVVLQRLGRGVRLVGVLLQDAPVVSDDWRRFASDIVHVSRDEMCAAVKAIFDDCDTIVEPMGALSVAGAVKFVQESKIAHERLLCVVDSPLRSFNALNMVTERCERADGSQCLLVVQQRDAGNEVLDLSALMKELSGTAGGRARVTCIRFSGTWPLILGLWCDETTTAAAHMANLTSLGYRASDITGADVSDVDVALWQSEESEEGKMWGVFQVELMENRDSVVNFLGCSGGEPRIRRVSFRYDGSGVARMIVGAQGAEWQLDNLESEMQAKAQFVKRIRGGIGGLSVVGCGVGRDGVDADVMVGDSNEGMASVVVPNVVDGDESHVGDGNCGMQATEEGHMTMSFAGDVREGVRDDGKQEEVVNMDVVGVSQGGGNGQATVSDDVGVENAHTAAVVAVNAGMMAENGAIENVGNAEGLVEVTGQVGEEHTDMAQHEEDGEHRQDMHDVGVEQSTIEVTGVDGEALSDQVVEAHEQVVEHGDETMVHGLGVETEDGGDVRVADDAGVVLSEEGGQGEAEEMAISNAEEHEDVEESNVAANMVAQAIEVAEGRLMEEEVEGGVHGGVRDGAQTDM